MSHSIQANAITRARARRRVVSQNPKELKIDSHILRLIYQLRLHLKLMIQ